MTGAGSSPADGLPAAIEAVLFDAGGVLVDLDYAYLRRLIEPHHREVPEQDLSLAEAHARKQINNRVSTGDRVGDLWRDYFYIILGRVGVPPDEHASLIDSLWEAHERVGLWSVPCDGAIKTVERIAGMGLRVGVVSNAEGQIERSLEDAGFKGFETVVDSHLVGVQKPDPAIFGIALERMSLRADRAIYVGDLPEVDVKGARAAGISAILLDRHDLYPGVDAPRLRTLSDLPDLLSAHLTG